MTLCQQIFQLIFLFLVQSLLHPLLPFSCINITFQTRILVPNKLATVGIVQRAHRLWQGLYIRLLLGHRKSASSSVTLLQLFPQLHLQMLRDLLLGHRWQLVEGLRRDA